MKGRIAAIILMCGGLAGATSHARSSDATPRHDAPRAEPDRATSCSTRGPLGVARTIAINPETGPLHLGLKTYPTTLDLHDHEVVLTFDDGPDAATTPMVLKALSDESVTATFFLVGRNAARNPDLVKREIAEGHTVGHHSNTHPAFTLRGFDDRSAMKDIDDGIAAVEHAGYGAEARPPDKPHVPFFRFPGFADSAFMLAMLDRRPMAVFGTDLWAADWLRMTPATERAYVIDQLETAPRRAGIILFHDTRRSTAAMLPGFLRALKARCYHIVGLRPSTSALAPAILTAPATWFSRTEKIIADVWPPIVPGAKHTLSNGPTKQRTRRTKGRRWARQGKVRRGAGYWRR